MNGYSPSEVEDDYEDEYDPDGDCSHCGGRGEEECSDGPLCFERNCSHGYHDCIACGGSGLARDQRIW